MTALTRSPGYTTRYTPFVPQSVAPGADFGGRIRRFFGEPFSQWMTMPLFDDLLTQSVGFRPLVEMTEKPEEFVVTAELPGTDRKDIHVGYQDGILTIRGEKQEAFKEKNEEERYLLWERFYGTFQRSFGLDGIDPEKIAASYKNGVLEVHLPKAPATKVKGREIPISNGR